MFGISQHVGVRSKKQVQVEIALNVIMIRFDGFTIEQ